MCFVWKNQSVSQMKLCSVSRINAEQMQMERQKNEKNNESNKKRLNITFFFTSFVLVIST